MILKKYQLVILLLVNVVLINCASVQKKETGVENKLLINHVGYPENGEKKVIFQTLSNKVPKKFKILDKNNQTVFKGIFNKGGKVDHWHTGKEYTGLFNGFTERGTYKIKTRFKGKIVESVYFEVKQHAIIEKALPLLLKGLQSAHPEQKIKDWDSKVPFFGERKDSADVHGGWYDASADAGKCLSHLGYSNYLTPQQTPIVVYNLLASAESYQKNKGKNGLSNELFKEAAYGGDFLVRMQDKEGYFYTNIFDNWTGDHTKREICAYETLAGTKTENYQAAFREGGGIAIAALAKLSRSTVHGDFETSKYLETAEKGFSHLLQNNLRYCDNGEENIIDDYCALMAASELYLATAKDNYLGHARLRALHLVYRLSGDENYTGWFRANSGLLNKIRPYYHAAEAGFPIIALCNYLEIEKDKSLRAKAISTIQRAITFELKITNDVYNPFGYPRQYVKATNEATKRATFFMPHHNETGYWYQGENARIASLAAAFNSAKPYMLPEQKMQAQTYVQNQINWILGLNPYDMCMLDGLGHNNPKHINQYNRNYTGGIANGITSGVKDESDIAFLPTEYKDDLAMNWRWTEQWIPHTAWFMLMITTCE